MKRVLVLSAGNPCRAIVAESLANKYIDKKLNIVVIGAGVVFSGEVNPTIMQALSEEGIDISVLKPRQLNEVLDTSFDLVITLCDHSKENCPVFPNTVRTIHMGMPVVAKDEDACKELIKKTKEVLVPLITSELA